MLPVKSPWKSILRALPFILILAILQILFLRPDEADAVLWTVFGFTITQSALMSAVMLVCRFIVLIWVINVFVMSISTSQMTAGLFHLLKPFEKIGFPVNDLTMVVQITLRYLPMLAQLAEKTAKAQASRGGDWDQKGFNPIKQAKRVLPLIVPLLVNSLKRAETMALAMESRGFSAGKQRGSFYSLTFKWGDILFVSLCLVVFVVMILFRRLF
jgi:energy-coupling factor transport system permease protein